MDYEKNNWIEKLATTLYKRNAGYSAKFKRIEYKQTKW